MLNITPPPKFMKNSDKSDSKSKFDNSIEKYFLVLAEKNLFVISLALISVIGFLIRLSSLDHASGDMNCFLLPWYNYYKESGMEGLKTGIGDYNIFYQFLIALMTKLPFEPIHCFKMLSIIFDFLLALFSFKTAKLITNDSLKAFFAYSAVFLSLPVFLNSSVWGQCDVIYVFFIIASLSFLFEEKYVKAFIFLGAAFAFKLQSFFTMPFYLFVYFYKKRFSAAYFLIIPVVMLISAIPGAVFGRNIFDVFTIYVNQTDSSHYMSMNYPNIWNLLDSTHFAGASFESLHSCAIYITLAVIALFFIYITINRISPDFKNMLYILFITSFTCVFFLPQMHDRYGYLAEVLAILLACVDKKMILPAVLINLAACVAYGKYLYGGESSDLIFSLMCYINLFAYFLSFKTILSEIIPKKEEP